MPMGRGKKKIEIKKREKESERMVTFSKRRKGLFKKAHQLHSLTAAQIAVLVFSPAHRPYTYGEPSFNSTIDQYYYNNINEEEDTELWRSWLGTMQVHDYDNLDDLLLLKDNLEQLRAILVQSIAANDR